MTAPQLALLGSLGLIGGVGITALGPGGVLPTIGLFALTGLSPAEVAGTAIVTHVATGALGTAAYTRSGQLREGETRRTAMLLAGAAVPGTPLGVIVNAVVDKRTFAIVLGAFVAAVAGLLWYREHHRPTATLAHPPAPVTAGLGLAVSAAGGLIGIGGPMLTVPILIALGVPALESLAAAQAQSVVIATIGATGYLLHGAVSWPLAALVGIPELAGVLLGWRIAHSLPTRTLRHALMVTLLLLGAYLVVHG